MVDGDTFWLNRVKYRIVDIDAPEAGDGARCRKERDWAERSTHYLAQLLTGNLDIVEHGKDRYGRILASVTARNVHISEQMIRAGLAISYNGGRRNTQQWCDR